MQLTLNVIYKFILCANLLVKLLLEANLIVSMSSRDQESLNPLKSVTFCIDCHSPEFEGSIIEGIAAKHNIKEYLVTGELVYCIPNFAESSYILNAHHFENRIVIVERGKISLIEKINKIQEYGAIGIIIADDGSCNQFYTFCGPRAGSTLEGGFAAYDDETVWEDIIIPVILINLEAAIKLRGAMKLQRIEIPNLGFQYMTLSTSFNNDEL
jgi:hypothetical protein